MSKKQLGQFMTTNYESIFDGLHIPDDIEKIVEPFIGNGDLLDFVKEYKVRCYDIDPGTKLEKRLKNHGNATFKERDTLENPPSYKNSFIVTNPPYLAKNKSEDKSLFNKYKTTDLFRCFIHTIIDDPSLGGIIIIPVNFWSSSVRQDILLRKKFLEIYRVIRLNIFEKQMFEDTSCCVCSFLFVKREDDTSKFKIYVYRPDEMIKIKVDLNEENGWTIGGEIFKLSGNNFTVTRLTSKNRNDKNTDIVVKCLDNRNEFIEMILVEDGTDFIDDTKNLSNRTQMNLVITPPLTRKEQKKLIKNFNTFLFEVREEYASLFLSSYREFSRKRISFELVYSISRFLLDMDDFKEVKIIT